MVEIDALGYFSSSDGQQNRATSVVTGLDSECKMHMAAHTTKTYSAVVLECDTRLVGIRGLDKYELVFPHFVQDALEWRQRAGFEGRYLGIFTISFQAATIDSMYR